MQTHSFGGELIGSLAGTVPLPFCSVVLSRPESLRAFYVRKVELGILRTEENLLNMDFMDI